MARKGILNPNTEDTGPRAAKPRLQPRGAVGALQSSLTKLQESAVQDVDPALIDDAGFQDRLGIDSAAQKQLIESLRVYGQQVPVLLRPHAKHRGRFEIVYGRRRLRALKELGQPVKAMIRQLDDQALVMAQGQENTARQDLSFAERAAFAAQLQAAGYDRQTIADALSTDLPMLSRLLKVGTAFPIDFFRAVGPAPGIGRDRWMQLVKLVENPAAMSRAVQRTKRPEFSGQSSEARFEDVLDQARTTPGKRAKPVTKARPLRSAEGIALADIRETRKAVTLNITGDFGVWLNTQAETLIQELHARFEKERSEDNDR